MPWPALQKRGNAAVYTVALTVWMSQIVPVAAQTTVDPASWVPADVLAFAGLTDSPSFLERFDAAAVDFEKQLKQRAARLMECKPEELRNPFGGPLAISLVRVGDAAPQPLIVAGVRDAAVMRDYYAKATANLARVAGRHESHAVGNDTVDVFHATAREAQEGSGEFARNESAEEITTLVGRLFAGLSTSEDLPETLAVCLTSDRLIVSGSRETAEAALRTGPSESLAGSTDYRDAMASLSTPGPARLFVNLPLMFAWMKSTNARGAEETLAILGGDCLRVFAGHATPGDEKSESRVEAVLRMSGKRSGFAKVISAPNRRLEAGAGEDCGLFAAFNSDPSHVLDEMEAVLRRVAPEQAERMQRELQSVSLGEGVTFNLRRDVLDHVRGPMTAALRFPSPISAEAVLLAINTSHNDRRALVNAAVIAQKVLPFVRQAADDMDVFVLPPLHVWIGIGDQTLQLGNFAGPAVMPPTSAAAAGQTTSAAFGRLAGLAPTEASAFLFVNGPRLSEGAIELTRQSAATPAALLALKLAELFTGEIDRSRLKDSPPGRLAGPNQLLTLTTTPEGVRFGFFRLPPDGTGGTSN